MADEETNKNGLREGHFTGNSPPSKSTDLPSTELPTSHSRRDLFKQAGLLGAAVIASSSVSPTLAAGSAGTESGSSPAQGRIREALETLTAVESETLDAMVSRIIPADDLGPGAREARATHYIDKCLNGHRSSSRQAYAIGLSALNAYSQASKGKVFHLLPENDQDTILMALQDGDAQGFGSSSSSFFNMVRSHTLEGTFSDPYYGGNRDFIGWELLGYPGVRLGASEDDVSQGSELSPSRRSAYDYQAFVKSGSTGGD